jgi:hypothetical protein
VLPLAPHLVSFLGSPTHSLLDMINLHHCLVRLRRAVNQLYTSEDIVSSSTPRSPPLRYSNVSLADSSTQADHDQLAHPSGGWYSDMLEKTLTL